MVPFKYFHNFRLKYEVMSHLIFSGVGGSSNWMPLIIPVAAFLLLMFVVELVAKFVRSRHHSKTSDPFEGTELHDLA